MRGWMLVTGLVGLVPGVAHADIGDRPRSDAGPNVVATSVGVDGSLVTWGVGFVRGIDLPMGRQLMVQTGFALPMTQPDFGDWRWTGGVRMNALERRGFEWPVSLNLVVRGLRNEAFRAVGLGTELRTMPGYYPGRWFLAADLAWDQQWATHLRHTDDYREFVYEDVRDGWYGNTAHTLQAGLRVGGRPWRHMELWVRGGYEHHGRYNTLAPPVYALAGVNFRF